MIQYTKIGLTTYVEVIQITPLSSSFSISNVILGVSRWQNPSNRFDVLNDGIVDLNDYNAIINYVADHGSGPLPRNRSVNQPYVDVNGDGIINNQDAVQLLAYLKSKKVRDTTPTKSYNIDDFKIERDLIDPTKVSTVKDVAAYKDIFPTANYSVFLRDLSTNTLTPISYSAAVSSRYSLVFVDKSLIVPAHPFTPGCYSEPCIFRLIRARISQSEILPIRFNKTVETTTVAAGTGLPMPGTDTSEMPAQPVVAQQQTPVITYVEVPTTPTTPTTPVVVTPPVTVLDLFPYPCVIIGEIKLVCVSTDGSNNSGTVACTAKMTSNTTPAPYVANADSEAVAYVQKSFTTARQMTDLCRNSGLPGANTINIEGEMNIDNTTLLKIAELALGVGASVIPGTVVEEHFYSPWDNFLSYWDAGGAKFVCKGATEMGNNMVDQMSVSNYVICPAWKAFNRVNVSETDEWSSTATAFPHYLQYDFGSAVVVNKYAIQEHNYNNNAGFPRDFTLQGSNDDVNWVVLDTRTGITAPGANIWSPYFTLSNGTAYRFYRLSVTAVAGGGLKTLIGELKLVCASMNGIDNPSTAPCTTIMAADDSPAPNVVSATSEYYSNYRSESYAAWRAFNGTNTGESDRWISATSNAPWYIEYDFGPGPGVPINKYAIQEQNYNGTAIVNGALVTEQNYNSDNGFPSDFALQASNDNTHWTTLDTRTNVAAPGMNNWTDWFTFTNGTSYRYYRLYITSVNGQLPMPITTTPPAPTPTVEVPDCVIHPSAKAKIRNVVVTQYNVVERTTPAFPTAGHIQTTLYSNQNLVITFNAYDPKGVFIGTLWLDGVRIPITTGPHAASTGGVNFGVAIGKRAAGVHYYTIVATNSDGATTAPPYECWFTVLQGGA